MKKIFIFLFLLVFSAIIAKYYLTLKKELSDHHFLFFLNSDNNENYSSYKLDPIQIITHGNTSLSIELEIVIKYTYQDFMLEKEIIQNRLQIRKFIRNFFSEKTYNQINKAYKRENLKIDIVKGINSILKNKIFGIYYASFIVL